MISLTISGVQFPRWRESSESIELYRLPSKSDTLRSRLPRGCKLTVWEGLGEKLMSQEIISELDSSITWLLGVPGPRI